MYLQYTFCSDANNDGTICYMCQPFHQHPQEIMLNPHLSLLYVEHQLTNCDTYFVFELICVFYFFQIGDLKDHYLFHHPRISKRSANPSLEHHQQLSKEPEVKKPFYLQHKHTLSLTIQGCHATCMQAVHRLSVVLNLVAYLSLRTPSIRDR